MLEITKNKNDRGYNFIISTEEGKFEISFQGNLDLYWRNIYQGNVLEQPESKSFTITKENYYLFSLFKELYENIKNCNIFKVYEDDNSLCENDEEIELHHLKKIELNNELKSREDCNPERLFLNGIIEWHCDDFFYDKASILMIKKEEDTFIVKFEKSKVEDIFLTYSVRLRNSGSRYDPFNLFFMRMYLNLVNYEPDFHQIHIEEYLWQKKLQKK